jgi:hypothetical protein
MLGENTGVQYTLRRSHTQVKRRRLRLLWSYLPDWYVSAASAVSRFGHATGLTELVHADTSIRLLCIGLTYVFCTRMRSKFDSCDRFSGCFYALDYVPGFEREFDLTDTSIQHSFTQHERVPVGSVFHVTIRRRD